MQKYRLTKKGKLVIVMLCTFIVLFISLGISFNKDGAPEYYDNNAPDNSEQQQAVVPEPPPVQVDKEEPFEDLKVAVYFEANMTSFDKQYHDALDIFTDKAIKHDSIKIQVEGNCATQFPKNQKQKSINYNLSLLRAQAVANYLQSKGIDSERVVIVANGSDKPLKDNSSPQGRKLNRRVDVYFIK